MGYVEKTLGDDEKIVFRVNFHWLYTAVAMFSLVILGWVLIGIPIFLYMMIVKWTTERVLTKFRFIKKTGWIKRKTEEIRVDRMEEINLDQSIFQRIFNAGNVYISGTGGSKINMQWIDNPLDFQKKLNDLKVETLKN